MESLRNEPVIFGGAPASAPAYGYGGGGLIEALVLASVLGGRGGGLNGFGGDTSGAALAYAQRAADNSAQLLTTVTKSEGDIKEATAAGLHRVQIETTAQFSNLHNRLCDSEKEAMKSGYEARLEAKETKSDLLMNQNANTIAIKDDIKDFRFANDKQFCELNTNIDKQFCDLEHRMDKQFRCLENEVQRGFRELTEREYKEEIRSLRDQIDKQQFRSVNGDLNEIRKDVDRILCGLGKLAPTNLTPTVLSGCC